MMCGVCIYFLYVQLKTYSIAIFLHTYYYHVSKYVYTHGTAVLLWKI